MPIYEYHCTACDHEFEEIQKVSDDPITDCPACHKPKAEKLVSAAGFQLKGTGWYVTDFRDKGKAPKADDSKSTSDKTKDSKSDSGKTKSASKSETKATSYATTES